MTGSLQIKNNKYYAVLNTTDHNGKRRPKWISTNLTVKGNKKRALAVLSELLSQYEYIDFNYGDMLAADYFADWVKRMKGLVARSTYRNYKGNMENHVIPYFRQRKIRLRDLKPYHLEDYYAFKLSEERENGLPPISRTSIQHHHRNISKALNDAVKREWIGTNPAQIATPPRAQKFIGQFLPPNKLRELVELFHGNVVEAPVMLITIYGLRRSEAMGLCWSCVDFENEQFTIAKTVIQDTGGDYVKNFTKNMSSYRTLPMTRDIKHLFERIKAAQEQNRAALGNCYIQTDFVFTWEDGTPISPNYLSRTFHEVLVKSDLPAIRLHDLRHSTASNLLANNFSVVEVQHWLGHSSAATTLNFYSHIDGTSKINVKNKLEELLPLEKC